MYWYDLSGGHRRVRGLDLDWREQPGRGQSLLVVLQHWRADFTKRLCQEGFKKVPERLVLVIWESVFVKKKRYRVNQKTGLRYRGLNWQQTDDDNWLADLTDCFDLIGQYLYWYWACISSTLFSDSPCSDRFYSLTLLFSGPTTCLCSRVEECYVNGDNEVDLVPNVLEETLCQELCAANQDCSFYTW